MVDASKEKEFDLNKVKTDELPEEMKKMNETEKSTYLIQKKTEREEVQKEIASLSQKRAEYLNTQNQSKEGMLDNALLSALKKQATEKNFKFVEKTNN